MAKTKDADRGIRLLIKKCHSEFRRNENMNFYSKNDLKEAEKKFVKFCLTGNMTSNSF